VQLNCSVVFDVTLRLIVINISSSSPAINKLRRLLPEISVTTCRGGGTVLITPDKTKRDTGQDSRFCLPHIHSTPRYGVPRRNIAMTFSMEKLEWCGYPKVKKIEDMFVRFDRMHERVRRTDGRTDTT